MKPRLQAVGLPYGTAALAKFGQAVPTEVQQAELESDVVKQSIAARSRVIALNTFGARRAEEPRAFVTAKVKAIADLIRQHPEITWALACGPSGDCYKSETGLGRAAAQEFHTRQLVNLGSLAKVASNNMVLFETFPGLEEALGAAQAVNDLSKQTTKKIQAVLSFALGADGRLRCGETLGQAIEEIDRHSNNVLAGFGANCCDLDAVNAGVETLGDDATHRFTTVYINAAKGDPARLEGCNSVVGLQNPDKVYLGFAELLQRYRQITTVGGCCGWDQAALAGLTTHLGIKPSSTQSIDTHNSFEIQIASY